MYEIEVSTNTGTYWPLDTVSTTDSFTTHYCGSWCNHWNTVTYPYVWTSYPTTKYLYQIVCPHKGCKTTNWLEIDQMKACKKCGSMLKAVSAKADYEVEVG